MECCSQRLSVRFLCSRVALPCLFASAMREERLCSATHRLAKFMLILMWLVCHSVDRKCVWKICLFEQFSDNTSALSEKEKSAKKGRWKSRLLLCLNWWLWCVAELYVVWCSVYWFWHSVLSYQVSSSDNLSSCSFKQTQLWRQLLWCSNCHKWIAKAQEHISPHIISIITVSRWYAMTIPWLSTAFWTLNLHHLTLSAHLELPPLVGGESFSKNLREITFKNMQIKEQKVLNSRRRNEAQLKGWCWCCCGWICPCLECVCLLGLVIIPCGLWWLNTCFSLFCYPQSISTIKSTKCSKRKL